MNATKLMVTTVMASLLLTSCNKENKIIPSTNDRALNVTGGIYALSRANNASWEANDAIGIFMLEANTTTISESAENRKYVTIPGNGNFSPQISPTDQTIYFPIEGKTDFIAYYPWQDIQKDGINQYLYAVDVSNQASQKAIDLMAATKVTDKDKDHTSVAFVFTHKLTKIALTEIKTGDGLTADDLVGLSVKLTKQQTKASYNVLSGSDISVISGSPSDIALSVADNSLSAEAIVLPTSSTSGMELVFTLSSGKTYSWALSNASQSTAFAAGSKYSYKITISNKGLNVTSTITNWLAGNGSGEDGTAQ